MKSYHLDIPGSKRFPKLVSKYFLSLLIYVDDPPYVAPSARTTKL